MTEPEFLKIFSDHVREGKTYFDRIKVLKNIEKNLCPFDIMNFKTPLVRVSDALNFRHTNSFQDAGGYYVFHFKQIKEKMIQIIEKEWKEI